MQKFFHRLFNFLRYLKERKQLCLIAGAEFLMSARLRLQMIFTDFMDMEYFETLE